MPEFDARLMAPPPWLWGGGDKAGDWGQSPLPSSGMLSAAGMDSPWRACHFDFAAERARLGACRRNTGILACPVERASCLFANEQAGKPARLLSLEG